MTGAERSEDAEQPTGMPAGPPGVSSPQGLSWSWDLDLEALVAAVNDPAPWERGAAGNSTTATGSVPGRNSAAAKTPPADKPATPNAAQPAPDPATPSAPADPSAPAEDMTPASNDPAASAPAADPDPDPVEVEFAEYLEAVEAGRSRVIPLPVVAGRIAESVPPGPELAAWADAGPVGGLEDGALAGIAASYRRLASWAQAGELATVAELTARSAAADDRIGVDGQGCPARIPDSASAEVSLALTMSQSAASWWTDLAVTLQWRLADTGAALRNGTIDLARAKAIAEATAALDEDTARSVQDRVLPRAGNQTLGQLRAALRRAVIAADPQGADRRREEAERRAKVTLYPDPDGTASLAGYNLPGINATAAMARVTALARALKASGAGGGIDLLRAQVFLGLLLGTLPYIPPPEDAPPDNPPDHDDPPDADHPPDDQPPEDGPPGDNPRDSEPSADGPLYDGPLYDGPLDDGPLDDGPLDDGLPDDCLSAPGESPVPDDRGRDKAAGHAAAGAARDGPVSGGADDDGLGARPPPAWPEVPAFLHPGPAALGSLRPVGGRLLDLRLSWTTLTADAGESSEPGYLSRLGPITPAQARHLADIATDDPAVRWRVIVTNHDNRAVASRRIRRAHHKEGLISQVTVTVRQDSLAGPQTLADLPPILGRLLAAAQSAAAGAGRQAAADAEAGDCAHSAATSAYRPTQQLIDFITARDLTCRFCTCRQPASHCDLDHTTPFDQGGVTCSCNRGPACRFHHQVKQHPGWCLKQTSPGIFTWTTPTGRTYTTEPDTHAA